MNMQSLATNLTKRKKIITIIITVLLFVLAIGLYCSNYLIDRFNPQSRIDFTIYSPHAEKRRRQLVIDNYMQQPLSWNVSRRARVITEDGENGIISEQKAQKFDYTCKGEFAGKCSMRQTKDGQKYVYTVNASKAKSNRDLVDEWARFEKGGTDILIHRNDYKDRPMNEASWDAYISSFQSVPSSQLKSFFYTGDKEVPFGG